MPLAGARAMETGFRQVRQQSQWCRSGPGDAADVLGLLPLRPTEQGRLGRGDQGRPVGRSRRRPAARPEPHELPTPAGPPGIRWTRDSLLPLLSWAKATDDGSGRDFADGRRVLSAAMAPCDLTCRSRLEAFGNMPVLADASLCLDPAAGPRNEIEPVGERRAGATVLRDNTINHIGEGQNARTPASMMAVSTSGTHRLRLRLPGWASRSAGRRESALVDRPQQGAFAGTLTREAEPSRREQVVRQGRIRAAAPRAPMRRPWRGLRQPMSGSSPPWERRSSISRR